MDEAIQIIGFTIGTIGLIAFAIITFKEKGLPH